MIAQGGRFNCRDTALSLATGQECVSLRGRGNVQGEGLGQGYSER